jgi:hypothetical protein
MGFIYDWTIKAMVDTETGDRLIFDRVLPEGATYVCRMIFNHQEVPFRATLTWEGSSPPKAMWLIEHLGKNLLGQLTVVLDPQSRINAIGKITAALLSYSDSLGAEFAEASIRVQS